MYIIQWIISVAGDGADLVGLAEEETSMSWGSWAMASLMMVAGANDPDITYLNQANFDIPVKFTEARQKSIREILLFSSTDLGKTWQQAGVTTPEKGLFPFTANADGMYWFSVVVIDQQGNRQPADIYKVPPSQRVVVDTRKPDLRILGAERQGDEVFVRWDLQEQNPDYANFKLEYRPAGSAANWTLAPVTQPASGQAVFRPNVVGPLSIRMTVQDLAGNQTMASVETTTAPVGGAGIAPVSGQAAMGLPAPPPLPSSPGTNGQAGSLPSMPQPVATGGRDWAPIQNTSLNRRDIGGPEAASTIPTATGSGMGTGLIAKSQEAPNYTSPSGGLGGGAVRSQRGTQADLLYVNHAHVTLQYEIAKLGTSGIGSVELYVTRDEGRTWSPSGGEKNINLPPTTELRTGIPMRRNLAVDLPEDGIYGFYLVVKSGVGLGKRPPKPGDAPEIRIELDTKAPRVEFFEPEVDPAQRDSLILSWNVLPGEPNLTDRPVTLEWAERKTGQWKVIGEPEMLNTGRYTWHVTPDVPARVHLRITVRDKAGNTGVATSDTPVPVDLNEPEVKFIGLNPPAGR
jgi:hypothetical protein